MSNLIKLSSPATKEFWEIPILFEDEHLLAVSKPAELLVSPDRYDPERPNLMKLLHHDIARAATWTKEKNLTYLANAHRLDFETTGVLLLAKSKPVLVQLADQFGSEKPIKIYVALTHGSPEKETFEVDAKLAPHPIQVQLMRVDPKRGKKSKTLFSIREKFSGYTLLECRPLTGRTHQIRAHLKYAGHSIIGDKIYGGGRQLMLSTLKNNYRLKPGREERPLISTLALHAEKLVLPHPITHQEISIEAPWPKDLQVAVKYLRRYAAAQSDESGHNPT